MTPAAHQFLERVQRLSATGNATGVAELIAATCANKADPAHATAVELTERLVKTSTVLAPARTCLVELDGIRLLFTVRFTAHLPGEVTYSATAPGLDSLPPEVREAALAALDERLREIAQAGTDGSDTPLGG